MVVREAVSTAKRWTLISSSRFRPCTERYAVADSDEESGGVGHGFEAGSQGVNTVQARKGNAYQDALTARFGKHLAELLSVEPVRDCLKDKVNLRHLRGTVREKWCGCEAQKEQEFHPHHPPTRAASSTSGREKSNFYQCAPTRRAPCGCPCHGHVTLCHGSCHGSNINDPPVLPTLSRCHG